MFLECVGTDSIYLINIWLHFRLGLLGNYKPQWLLRNAQPGVKCERLLDPETYKRMPAAVREAVL